MKDLYLSISVKYLSLIFLSLSLICICKHSTAWRLLDVDLEMQFFQCKSNVPLDSFNVFYLPTPITVEIRFRQAVPHARTLIYSKVKHNFIISKLQKSYFDNKMPASNFSQHLSTSIKLLMKINNFPELIYRYTLYL